MGDFLLTIANAIGQIIQERGHAVTINHGQNSASISYNRDPYQSWHICHIDINVEYLGLYWSERIGPGVNGPRREHHCRLSLHHPDLFDALKDWPPEFTLLDGKPQRCRNWICTKYLNFGDSSTLFWKLADETDRPYCVQETLKAER